MSLTKSAIQDKLKQHFQLPPNELQGFLRQLSQGQDICEICSMMIEMMYSSRYESTIFYEIDERLHSATSFNYLIRLCFKKMEENRCSVNKGQIYSIYRDLIATRNSSQGSYQEEYEGWKLGKITFKVFVRILQDFEENEFTVRMQEIYMNMNMNHKILLQGYVLLQDVDKKEKDLFLQETIENYFILGIQQLEWIQGLKQEQRLQIMESRFLEYLLNLKKTFKYLEKQTFEDKNKKRFFRELLQKQEIFRLIEKCICFSGQNSIKKSDENRPIVLFNCKGSSKKQEIVNQIKALGLEIFCHILSFFSTKSVVEDFDSNRFLGLMQKIVPQIISQMSNMKQNELCLDYNEKLAIGALKTVQKSYSFVFMNNELMKRNNDIFWRIIYPLLSATGEQMRAYKDDSEILIAQIESLIEMSEDDQNRIESCKTYAGGLLEKMVGVIDISLPFILEGVLAIMEAEISKDSNQVSRQIQNVYGVRLSLQTCFTVVSVLMLDIKKREDFLRRVRQYFYRYQRELLCLKEIQKVRLLSFLTYNFAIIFEDISDCSQTGYSVRTHEYYEMINNSLEQNELIMKCSLDFIKNQYKLQEYGFMMVDRIFEMIENTKSSQILQVLLKIIKVEIVRMEYQKVVGVLRRLLVRIEIQNEQYIRALENKQIYSDLLMIRCFQGVGEIVEYYGRNEKGERCQEIMGIVWKVFDYMVNITKASYAQILIEIFNNVLLSLKVIDGPDFFQFLPLFEGYHRQCEQLGNLFYTYNILITKGRNYLKNTKEGNDYLNYIVGNTFMCLDSRYVLSSYIAIILLQYIFAYFPQVEINHEFVWNVSRQIMEQKREQLDEEKISAIYNLWIIGSSISGVYDLGGLEDLNLKGVYGYHAKVFALGIYIKVGVLLQQIKGSASQQLVRGNIMKIGYLLRKGVKFIKIYDEFNRKIEVDVEEMIENIAKINPYNEIKCGISLVKENLLGQDYEQVMKQISKQIQIYDLKKLLGKAQVGERIIYTFRK